ncbi:MAG: hypothetical protein F6J93_08290 [Oscillatoria sp. SIO1A7]|nr:hypothetical protein [Oscillatoria sp. SIO1A7]
MLIIRLIHRFGDERGSQYRYPCPNSLVFMAKRAGGAKIVGNFPAPYTLHPTP